MGDYCGDKKENVGIVVISVHLWRVLLLLALQSLKGKLRETCILTNT
jgi:hypothetical protein